MEILKVSMLSIHVKALLLGAFFAQFLLTEGLKFRYDDCGIYEPVVRKGVESVYKAATVAKDRTKKLVSELKRDPGPNDTIDPEVLSSLMVFEALYGPVYYGKTQKQERKEGVKRVKKVLDKIQTLIDKWPENRNGLINIRCSEKFMNPKAPPGVTLSGVEVWDERPTELGGQRVLSDKNWRTMFGCIVFDPDEQEPHAYLYTIPGAPVGTYDCLIICPQTLKDGLNYPGLSDYATLGEGQYTIRIHEIATVSVAHTIIHELSHSYVIYGNDFFVDIDEAEYDYEDAVVLAQASWENAFKNAENFALWLTIMTLHRNDWSTGRAQRLPPVINGPLRGPLRITWDGTHCITHPPGGITRPPRGLNNTDGELKNDGIGLKAAWAY